MFRSAVIIATGTLVLFATGCASQRPARTTTKVVYTDRDDAYRREEARREEARRAEARREEQRREEARREEAREEAYRATHGKVVQIDRIEVTKETGPEGAIIGGVVGGVVGNQFGKGKGKAAMTVAGAVGGAVVGNEIQKSQNKPKRFWRVTVKLDNGGIKRLDQDTIGSLRVGDRVAIDKNGASRV
ncbi:glycine zipper 2TM domain-containing protein [Chitinimonas sp.]|uniref:glycine zipper 2TM domain-containing protein n=1 Tax=Chitinimonas sp. TaxID=1934313 RepID=UPI002F95F9ED